MNKDENNEQFDTDILRCKVDILRARKVIPLRDETAPKNPESQNNSDVAAPQNTGLIPIETIPAEKTAPLPAPAESSDEKKEALEIPSFNLAEELMAEQRRITAIKRKAPGGKPEFQRLKPEPQPVEHIIEEPKSALSEQEQIIADIVAGDIERLCRGDYSADNK